MIEEGNAIMHDIHDFDSEPALEKTLQLRRSTDLPSQTQGEHTISQLSSGNTMEDTLVLTRPFKGDNPVNPESTVMDQPALHPSALGIALRSQLLKFEWKIPCHDT